MIMLRQSGRGFKAEKRLLVSGSLSHPSYLVHASGFMFMHQSNAQTRKLLC